MKETDSVIFSQKILPYIPHYERVGKVALVSRTMFTWVLESVKSLAISPTNSNDFILASTEQYPVLSLLLMEGSQAISPTYTFSRLWQYSNLLKITFARMFLGSWNEVLPNFEISCHLLPYLNIIFFDTCLLDDRICFRLCNNILPNFKGLKKVIFESCRLVDIPDPLKNLLRKRLEIFSKEDGLGSSQEDILYSGLQALEAKYPENYEFLISSVSTAYESFHQLFSALLKLSSQLESLEIVDCGLFSICQLNVAPSILTNRSNKTLKDYYDRIEIYETNDMLLNDLWKPSLCVVELMSSSNLFFNGLVKLCLDNNGLYDQNVALLGSNILMNERCSLRHLSLASNGLSRFSLIHFINCLCVSRLSFFSIILRKNNIVLNETNCESFAMLLEKANKVLGGSTSFDLSENAFDQHVSELLSSSSHFVNVHPNCKTCFESRTYDDENDELNNSCYINAFCSSPKTTNADNSPRKNVECALKSLLDVYSVDSEDDSSYATEESSDNDDEDISASSVDSAESERHPWNAPSLP